MNLFVVLKMYGKTINMQKKQMGSCGTVMKKAYKRATGMIPNRFTDDTVYSLIKTKEGWSA